MKKDSMLVLQEFEINRLNLEGAEIIAYAVLFKNSMFCNQMITHDVFRNICGYIEEWLDVLYPGILIDINEVIDKLIAKGLVEKNREGIRVYDNFEN